MIVGMMRMKAGTGAEPHSHPNEQWIYVMEGRLRLVLGDQDLVLGPGEVAEFDTRTPHWFGCAEGRVVDRPKQARQFDSTVTALTSRYKAPPEETARKVLRDGRGLLSPALIQPHFLRTRLVRRIDVLQRLWQNASALRSCLRERR